MVHKGTKWVPFFGRSSKYFLPSGGEKTFHSPKKEPIFTLYETKLTLISQWGSRHTRTYRDWKIHRHLRAWLPRDQRWQLRYFTSHRPTMWPLDPCSHPVQPEPSVDEVRTNSLQLNDINSNWCVHFQISLWWFWGWFQRWISTSIQHTELCWRHQ